jgi:hypothetical protein
VRVLQSLPKSFILYRKARAVVLLSNLPSFVHGGGEEALFSGNPLPLTSFQVILSLSGIFIL